MESLKRLELLVILTIVCPLMITCQSKGELNRGPPSPAALKGYISDQVLQLRSRSQQYPEYYQSQSQSQTQSQSQLQLQSQIQSQSYTNPSYSQNYDKPYYPDNQNQQVYNKPQYTDSQPVYNKPTYSDQNQHAYYSQPPSQYIQPTPPQYIQQTPQYYDRPASLSYYPQPPYQQSYSPIPSMPVPRPLPPPPVPPKNSFNTQSQPNFSTDSRFTPEDPQNEFSSSKPQRNTTRIPATTKKPPVVTRFDNRDNPEFKKMLFFDEELSNSMESFSLELLDYTHYKLPHDNFMISPFSVYHLLVLIAEGARGRTLDELQGKLNFKTIERTRDFQQYLNTVLKRNTADVIIEKFSMMITDIARPPALEYENRIEKIYETEVTPVDFRNVDRTVADINRNISVRTRGQIQETIIRDDLLRAQLLLLSGLFFQGKWANVFNTTFTKREAFYDTNGTQTGEVNMMFQRGPFAYAAVRDLGCHILELPYADSSGGTSGTSLSMILALPRKGLSLEGALGNIYQFGMRRIYKELANSKSEAEDDEVEVHLPRFDITTSLQMQDILKDMGIVDIFETSADLSNINKQYYVSSMIHKTKMSVDERGTTASAVTTAILANKATPPKFHANRPFIFFIVDKVTNLILFTGQYAFPGLH